jgi:hypothetical protein
MEAKPKIILMFLSILVGGLLFLAGIERDVMRGMMTSRVKSYPVTHQKDISTVVAPDRTDW